MSEGARGRWRVVGLALALCWALACDGGAPAEELEAAKRAPIEVFTWGGLQIDLVREHERRHPMDQIIHANPLASATARRVLSERLRVGDPPDSFQSIAGQDLMQWVLFNHSDTRESRLRALDDLPGMDELRGKWPRPLLDAVSQDGRVYGMPANVHRINEIFYNPGVLAQVGATAPRSLDELLALGAKLKAKGIPLLAVGSKDPWTLSVLVFESLLVSQHGPDFYESYFAGKRDPNDARLRETLQTGLRLLAYANPDRHELGWDQAAQRVFDGRAAMTVMGDWARTLFDGEGVEQRYREMSFPGTESVFVFACNVFPLPVRAKNPEGARRLLATLGSLEGQAAIARSRTSIPTRLDADSELEDPGQRDKQRLWRSGRLVPALSSLASPRFASDLSQALKDADQQGRVSPVLHTVRARYMLIGR